MAGNESTSSEGEVLIPIPGEDNKGSKSGPENADDSFPKNSSHQPLQQQQSKTIDAGSPRSVPICRSFSNPRHDSSCATPVMGSPDTNEEKEGGIYKSSSVKKFMFRCRIKVKTIIKWVAFFSSLGCLVASLTIEEMGRVKIWGFELWRWSVLLMVTTNGMFITNWFMHLSFFLIERNFPLKQRILLLLNGLKRNVQILSWAFLILLTRIFIFDHGDHHKPSKTDSEILHYVTNNLIALLIGSILWMLKSFFVVSVTSKFHVNAFFDRIQESMFHQYSIQTLSGPPLMELARKTHAADTGSSSKLPRKRQGPQDVWRMREKEVSGWNMKILANGIRNAPLSTVSNAWDDFQEENDVVITSEWEAKDAAGQIFINVAKPGSKYIEEEDLLRFFCKEEADLIFGLLGREDKRISKNALKEFVVKAYRERKALAFSLNDTHIVVKQLNKFVTWILVLVIFNIWLLLMGLSSSQVLISQILGAAFIFGNTCKNIFEGIIFILAVHPFDVGDRCAIDGVVLLVEEVNILNTIFLKLDNEKVYYPNSVLATKSISNYYRSPDMCDSVEFTIDIRTPTEQIEILKNRIKKYLESKPKHWHPGHALVAKEIEDENKLRMVLHCSHKMNFQNVVDRNNRRTKLVIELKKILEELKMRFSLIPQQQQQQQAVTSDGTKLESTNVTTE